MGYKWIALVISFTLVWVSVYYAIIPAVSFLFLSTKESSELKDILLKIIPETAQIDTDIIPNKDLFVIAWDLNNRTPRFFSKESYEKYTKEKDATVNHHLSLSEMVLASAVTPYYFRPAEI